MKPNSCVQMLKNFSGIDLTSVDLDSISVEQGFLTFFCLVYPLPKEQRAIYPHCTTTAFSSLKIKVFFSLELVKFTPSIRKINPQGVTPGVENDEQFFQIGLAVTNEFSVSF